MVARIEIELCNPLKREKFDDIIIHLHKDNELYSTNINFDFNPLYSFARDKESIAFDFLLFSIMIYNIDRFVNRNIFSLEGWTREIEVTNMPVIHTNEFQNVKSKLDDAISFLTGDNWNINFCEYEGARYNAKSDIKDWGDLSVYDEVCLFSGGLDSLIGAINKLENGQSKLLLISHKESGREGTDQNDILTLFNQLHFYDNKYDQIQTSVGIGKKVIDNKIEKEATFRSRSLLFIGMGIYAAYRIGRNIQLIIPENGTIALNIPLMSSRRSACSTRTTHPTFLSLLQNILTEIGIFNPMYNPYDLKTKGEMVDKSQNSIVLQQLIHASCSCAKRGHNFYWDANSQTIIQNNIRHCGMCLPCIYRRVSLHMNNLDQNVNLHYGTDIFNGIKYDINNKEQKSTRDFRTLLEFIKNRPTIERIEKELLINGVRDISKLHEYALVIDRTIDQIIDWIRASGNHVIKRKAGI